ncbi:hypothetical protein B5X24_HaOG204555 [Helicoverpa armigera]|nr:hypothetical protein B5X24_HaOG204555 [Helicoverpa armigera]
MSSKIVILVLIASMANAAQYRQRLPEKPPQFKNIPGCYIPERNEVIPFGAVVSNKGCILIQCTVDSFEYTTCPIAQTRDPKCRVYHPFGTSTYPDCCPQLMCDVS